MRNSLLFILSSFLSAQSLSIISELDTTQGYIGDIFLCTITVEGQNTESIRFPELSEINDTLSIRNQTLIHHNGNLIGIQFELMAWDTGSFSTPNYEVDILKTDGALDYSIVSNPNHFTVKSLLQFSESSDFRPLKGPVPVRRIFPTKTVLLSLILMVMLGSMIWTWKQRKVAQYRKINYSLLESPEDRAQRRLMNLKMNGLSKDYYADLSHISREYIETKYFIRALEMTTEEINTYRSLFPLEDIQFSIWAEFLAEADLVKYAREIPTQEKMSSDKEKITLFISEV